MFKQNKRIGFEFKFSDSPKTTKSMHQALSDLKLDHLYVIHPGQKQFPLANNITAVGLSEWHRPESADLRQFRDII